MKEITFLLHCLATSSEIVGDCEVAALILDKK